jgi:hypothetical protein
VRAIGQPIVRQVMDDGSGRRFGEFTSLPGLPNLAMRRDALNRVLHDHAVIPRASGCGRCATSIRETCPPGTYCATPARTN